MVLRAFAIILLLGISVLGERVFARALLDLEAAYLQDTIQAAETANRTRSVFGGGVYVPLDNREKYFLGASFLTGSLVEGQTTGTLQMTTQDLVLAARWIVDRDRTFHLVAGFGPFTQASYRAPAATATELWNGTSMYFRFVAAPEVKGRLNIGMSFTYYSATFVKREVSNTTSTINYSASYLLPGLALSFLW